MLMAMDRLGATLKMPKCLHELALCDSGGHPIPFMLGLWTM